MVDTKIFQRCIGYNFIVDMCSCYIVIHDITVMIVSHRARYVNFFSVSSTKSTMTTKILCHSLELELLHGFLSCLVKG